jgi:hypothetical protein
MEKAVDKDGSVTPAGASGDTSAWQSGISFLNSTPSCKWPDYQGVNKWYEQSKITTPSRSVKRAALRPFSKYGWTKC